MSKTTFKKLNLKKLREKFDYEKFYNYLTNKIKAANGKLYCPHGVITNLEENLGIDYKDIYKYNYNRGRYIRTPRCVLDKNYPSLSFEDGSIFTFFNKNIRCEMLFARFSQEYSIESLTGASQFISRDRYAQSFLYYFLFSFKDKEKKVLTKMYNHPDDGWEMDVIEIFNKKTKISVIYKKFLKKVFKEDKIGFQFMFFSKSLKINIKKFVETFQKKLKLIFPNNQLYPNFIRNLDMYIYEIYPNIKIPFLSNIDTSSVPDFFHKNNKISKNTIELKIFKKGKTSRLLGRKVEIKKTKKFKVKPLFVYRFLKDDWKRVKGKLTGIIYL